MPIKNEQEFKGFVKNIEDNPNYKRPLGFGIFCAQFGQLNTDKILTGTFPTVNWENNFGSAAVFMDAAGALEKPLADLNELVVDITAEMVSKMQSSFEPYLDLATGKEHKNVQAVKFLAQTKDLTAFKLVFIFEDTEAQSIPAAYLKLSAMSCRKVKPNTINLNGIFGKLSNVAWSGTKAYEIEYLQENEVALKMSGKYPAIDYVDKFPRYLMQMLPESSSRILDTSRVRFGAYIGEGTTIMPGASYINFNAGTEGPAMVEGRISSSAFVHAGTDVGGGASMLGTLSGGNATPISTGKNCLLGANSVTGVPLGDGCIVDAGIAILAGTKIAVSADQVKKLLEVNPELKDKLSGDKDTHILKGADFTFANGVHFRQDSQTGAMQAMRSAREVELNTELHEIAS